MNKINKDYSLEEMLRDTKHNLKAQEVFMKLIARQMKPANPFDKARTQTWNPTSETKPGSDYA